MIPERREAQFHSHTGFFPLKGNPRVVRTAEANLKVLCNFPSKYWITAKLCMYGARVQETQQKATDEG